MMRETTVVILGILAIFVLLPISASSSDCESPSDYIRKVYTTQEGTVEYELDPSIEYKQITVLFFGKRGQVKRANTVITLQSPKGTFSIPERAMVPPAQLWFNFKIKDSKGCERWGLVNEVPIQGQGNLIGIDSPSGEGDAFYLKSKR